MSAEMILAVSALVTAVGSVLSAFLLNRKTVSLLEWRMKEIERKIEVFDNTATTDRIARMETDIAVIKTNIEFLKQEVSK